jgi:AraC-like DNA-binding protein
MLEASVVRGNSDLQKLTLNAQTVCLGCVLAGTVDMLQCNVRCRCFDTGDWFFLGKLEQDTNLTISSGGELLMLRWSEQDFLKLVAEREDVPAKIICLGCPSLEDAIIESAPMVGRFMELARKIAALDERSFCAQFQVYASVYDLLNCAFHQRQFADNCCCSGMHRQQDCAALQDIADFLEKNCTMEHSLRSLSRQFHINEFKLKKGFREHYGQTVFQYLRHKRMHHAYAKFQSGANSVLEVAVEVGYSNASHFARAFREEFGLNPRDVLRR